MEEWSAHVEQIEKQILAGKSPKGILIDFINHPGMTEAHYLFLCYTLTLSVDVDVTRPDQWIENFSCSGDAI